MFNLTELSVLRSGLETVTILGKEARLLVALQDKVEMHINNLQQGPPQENTKLSKGRKISK
tara:strand:- start:245 stop:427 length:183 start_codon:yes stop_codon:yes gene_type:complete